MVTEGMIVSSTENLKDTELQACKKLHNVINREYEKPGLRSLGGTLVGGLN